MRVPQRSGRSGFGRRRRTGASLALSLTLTAACSGPQSSLDRFVGSATVLLCAPSAVATIYVGAVAFFFGSFR